MEPPQWILDKWLCTISNPNFNVVQSMQDKFQNILDQKFEEKNAKKFLENEQFAIEEFLKTQQPIEALINGVKFVAKFVDGERSGLQGKASLMWTWNDSSKVVKLDGFFHQDFLFGNVARTTFKDGKLVSTELFYCKKGVLNGFYRKSSCTGQLEAFGVYLNGVKEGTWWRGLTGGSYFVTQKSQREGKESESIFLYPDLVTSLVGHFEETSEGEISMKRATVRLVTRLQLTSFGILNVGFDDKSTTAKTSTTTTSTTMSEDYFCGEKSDAFNICERPLIPDPYEERHVVVRSSSIPSAGEGLFARTDFEAGKVVAFFHGVRVDIGEQKNTESSASSDYSISCSGPDQTIRTILDIPERCRGTDVYCATLAHKICHSFCPNATYSNAFHPRFGNIRCAVSLRKIYAGEEICCDYKYSLAKAPEWYLQSLKDHLTNEVGISKDQFSF